MEMFKRTVQPSNCANCHRATSARRYENGRDYCKPCGERLEQMMRVRPAAVPGRRADLPVRGRRPLNALTMVREPAIA
jgi:hypothetical protein